MRFDDVQYFHLVEYSPYKEPSGLSGGQIAGIVLGCVALVAVVIAVIIMARKGMFKISGIIFSYKHCVSSINDNNEQILN